MFDMFHCQNNLIYLIWFQSRERYIATEFQTVQGPFWNATFRCFVFHWHFYIHVQSSWCNWNEREARWLKRWNDKQKSNAMSTGTTKSKFRKRIFEIMLSNLFYLFSLENSNFSLQRQANIIYWAMRSIDKMK